MTNEIPDELFEFSKRKMITLNIEKENKKLKSYTHDLKYRSKQQVDQVNSLLNTFDLLHLQEISLITRRINRKQHLNKTTVTAVTDMRRGGLAKKRFRDKLDQMLKLGNELPKDANESSLV